MTPAITLRLLEAEDDPGVRSLEAGGAFIEATGESQYLLRVIRAGLSKNRNYYPDAVLREAVNQFQGAKVYVKSDEDHLAGRGRDVRNLIGRLTDPRFVEGQSTDTGEIRATLELLESADIAPKLRELYERGMTDAFGFSIDALALAKKRRGNIREATRITQVNSLDLIDSPSAGGQMLAREAHPPQEDETVLKQSMLEAIMKAHKGQLPEGLDETDDEAVLAAYREAVQPDTTPTADKSQGAGSGGAVQIQEGSVPAATGVTEAVLNERLRMVEARAGLQLAISTSGLPDYARARLEQHFAAREAFGAEDVSVQIQAEREYLAKITEAGHVQGLGGGPAVAGEDRSEKMQQMFDDFFDPAKPAMSIRECYKEFTGDKGVTGLMQHCDAQRMKESAGAVAVREAVSAATFGNALGDSITRAMLREYAVEDMWSDWRWLVDVVPVSDFRTQERTRVGGYGDLPVVAENGPYAALTSPTDEKASYALQKRGGTETLSLEAISNDDVGLIQRIPMKLSMSAKRTLYTFVLDFLDSNAAIYDAKALFHADHANLATVALDATNFAAMRLRMADQAELSSAAKLGLVLRHLAVPLELEETAFDLFVRTTNNDESFVQSRKPVVHVVPYWTDANNWYGMADKRELPLIEVGFYNGREEPELFIQDNPTQGSLFSNDQIQYKMRHIYKGAVMDWRGFQANLVA